eukprot:TRINITY_DN2471_c0_g1_i2.p1 TRINITY_DN2471_c0_g1~~TRINITY_DN2471_c0_g1_i2.p1  ORF type:complete len:410 (+),score=147.06 TRINITY_DN2471_c0_g1_i2:53-1282(+)
MTSSLADKKIFGLWINGAERPSISGRTIPIEDPSTTEIFGHVAEAAEEDVKLAIKNADEVFQSGIWSQSNPKDRANVLFAAARILRERLNEIIDIEVRSIGRPIREMKAQITRLPEWLEYFGSLCMTFEGGVTGFTGNFLNYYRRVPLGVVGQITPWNHPLLIAVKKAAPAIAAGNSVVIKPSELAPISVLVLGEIFSQAGLPAGVLNVVPGYGATAGRALSESPLICKIDLTGGTPTGRIVGASAGRNLAAVTSELGGKAPFIVFDDADLIGSVNMAAFAAFIATGQTCVAATRILVHKSVFAKFQELFVEKIKAIRVGDPKDACCQLGPLISKDQRDRVAQLRRHPSISIRCESALNKDMPTDSWISPSRRAPRSSAEESIQSGRERPISPRDTTICQRSSATANPR